eukprot:COSAG01_NODE_8128_length_2911_cov_9.972617_4_plen_21_part_01
MPLVVGVFFVAGVLYVQVWQA